MIRFHCRLLDPGCGRPFARPLVWCRTPQNCRWMPVAARIVARTYLSLNIHPFSFTTDGQRTCLRPLSDGVQQAGQSRIPERGNVHRTGGPRSLLGVDGADRPFLWPNCLAPPPLSLSLLVWKESRIEVPR
jgi:hypothetical protein